MSVCWLTPQWPAPPSVRALSTFRTGGVSAIPYASLNLAAHVGDEAAAVAAFAFAWQVMHSRRPA